MEKKWDVDVERLVTLLSDRMYSDQAVAGIRELIANSIDARRDGLPSTVSITLAQDGIHYTDDGTGIQDFANSYGVIGSGSKEDTKAIGMFGIGRLALIARLKGEGIVASKRVGDPILAWKVNRHGWKQETQYSIDILESGFFLAFPNLDLEIDPSKVMEDMARIFTIPIHEGLVYIIINGKSLKSHITGNYDKVKTDDYSLYYNERQDGKVHYCHNGVEVRSESFTGLDAWANEDHLHIKTDREGYVSNTPYHKYLQSIRNTLRKLRPSSTIKQLEIEFMEKVMTKFRIFLKTVKKSSVFIPEKVMIIGRDESIVDSPLYIPVIEEESTQAASSSNQQYHIVEESPVGETPTGAAGSNELMDDRETIEETPKTPEKEEYISAQSTTALVEEPKITKPRIPQLRGARAVDLGIEYPMMFFEKDPFLLVFNNTHPVMKEMIETEVIDNRAMAVLYERMLECFYLQDEEDIESIKERWRDIDAYLKEML